MIFRKANASTWATSAWLVGGTFDTPASAANYLEMVAAAASAEPTLKALGSDTDIDLQLTPKGAGLVTAGVRGVQYIVPVVLARDVTATTVTNDTTPTTFFSVTVPANVLGTNRMLRLSVIGELLSNDAATLDITFNAKFGGTTFGSLLFSNFQQSATRRPLWLQAELVALNSASLQVGHLIGMVGNIIGVAGGAGGFDYTAAPGAGDQAKWVGVSAHTGLGIDTTADRVFEAELDWSAAGGLNTSCIIRTCILELI
jgi:hypothetical protein